MLRRDLLLYQRLLSALTLSELAALYERTAPEYAPLAQAIADEISLRLGMI